MDNILKIIGANIHKFRISLGLSQEKLAENSGLHRTYIGAVERGERNISAKNIEKIANHLGILPKELLNAEEVNNLPQIEVKELLPVSIKESNFNNNCILPYGLKVDHIAMAMKDFIDFLGFLNQQLVIKELPRLENFIMPANFSSMVGEFMNLRIPAYCSTLVRNQYPNGHPDLIPIEKFPDNSTQYSTEGIEIKGSRNPSGWQGHNPEKIWLMVFYFDSNTLNDKEIEKQKPFQFRGVYAAKLEREDWSFSGRSTSSRRTITASVNGNGLKKMKENWIFKLN